MPKKEILLQLKNIHVHYGGVRALDGVNLTLHQGEIMALMGPNGAGKSTVLKTIFGLAPIFMGDVLWYKQRITPISYEMVERGISFVPQGRRVLKNLTVKENLEIGAYIVKNNNLIRKKLTEVLEIFPILKLKLNDNSGSLSGGQQQMLAIARGLMIEPKILLLDEPALGLSPKIIKEVLQRIKEINEQQKTTIIVVEQNIKSVLNIADLAYILDKGRVVWADKTDKLKNNNILKKVFTGQMACKS